MANGAALSVLLITVTVYGSLLTAVTLFVAGLKLRPRATVLSYSAGFLLLGLFSSNLVPLDPALSPVSIIMAAVATFILMRHVYPEDSLLVTDGIWYSRAVTVTGVISALAGSLIFVAMVNAELLTYVFSQMARHTFEAVFVLFMSTMPLVSGFIAIFAGSPWARRNALELVERISPA